MIGLGVAGNFTGHLEQAGEASDFINVTVNDTNAPKGLFPFYVPANTANFIETYPLSSDAIFLPNHSLNLQIEPELALICEITYNKDKITNLLPKFFSAFNDCSIRKEGANKISEKKNWGKNSKGLSDQLIPIDDFSSNGLLHSYRLASFLKRDSILHDYGVDSAISSYSYIYQKLITWVINKMNHQTDHGPLENISDLLKIANYPKHTLISIGATKYTDFGAKTYLKKNDEAFVIAYDSNLYDKNDIIQRIKIGDFINDGLSVLQQTIV